MIFQLICSCFNCGFVSRLQNFPRFFALFLRLSKKFTILCIVKLLALWHERLSWPQNFLTRLMISKMLCKNWVFYLIEKLAQIFCAHQSITLILLIFMQTKHIFSKILGKKRPITKFRQEMHETFQYMQYWQLKKNSVFFDFR